MKILMLTAEDFGIEDLQEAFQSLGCEVKRNRYTQDELLDERAERIRRDLGAEGDGSARAGGRISVSGAPDAVFTFNYFPPVAIACKELGIRYLSWVYDNPCVHLFSYTVIFPTNTVYVFEEDTARYFQAQGIGTVHYLPLAANPERLARVWEEAVSEGGRRGSGQPEKPGSGECAEAASYASPKEISFVGSLYTEKHNFYSRMLEKGISPYAEGYLRGLMEAQKLVYGCDLVEAGLTPVLLDEMYKGLPLGPGEGSVVTREYLFGKYVLDRQITAEERKGLLSLLGERYPVDVYTVDGTALLPGCVNHGPAHSLYQAPLVYRSSKINLNITLRSIANGIPLRAFEIMGSGGFLLTNYQSELLNFFVPGEDFVYFESREDLLAKVEYYLAHDEERRRIAESGLAKVRESHTFRRRAEELLRAPEA